MNITIYGDLYSKKEQKAIISKLKSRGIINNSSSKLVLQIDSLSDGNILINIFSEDVFLYNYNLNLKEYKDINELTREIFNNIFVIKLN